jgi:hypothetical protein
MSFIKSYDGYISYTTTRKQPELVFDEDVVGNKVFYLDAITEAMYIVVQLPNGNTSPVTVNCYQSLTTDDLGDDTEPVYTFSFDVSTTRIQKSDIVLSVAPYLKIEIQSSESVQVRIFKDLI